MQARMSLVPFLPAPHKERGSTPLYIYSYEEKRIHNDFYAMTVQQPCIQFQPQVKLLISIWYVSNYTNLGI